MLVCGGMWAVRPRMCVHARLPHPGRRACARMCMRVCACMRVRAQGARSRVWCVAHLAGQAVPFILQLVDERLRVRIPWPQAELVLQQQLMLQLLILRAQLANGRPAGRTCARALCAWSRPRPWLRAPAALGARLRHPEALRQAQQAQPHPLLLVQHRLVPQRVDAQARPGRGASRAGTATCEPPGRGWWCSGSGRRQSRAGGWGVGAGAGACECAGAGCTHDAPVAGGMAAACELPPVR